MRQSIVDYLHISILLITLANYLEWIAPFTTVYAAETESQNSVRPHMLLKVVNGAKAAQGEFPYAAHILLRSRTACGGTLISNRHILTAAHCVLRSPKPNATEAEANQLQLLPSIILANDTQSARNISKIQIDTYNTTTSENDLAILTLAQPILLSVAIRPARLTSAASNETSQQPTQLLSFGWGRNASYQSSTELRWVNMVYGQENTCHLASPEYVTPFRGPFICAIGHQRNTGRDNLHADLNNINLDVADLIVTDPNELRVLGVLSFGASSTDLVNAKCATDSVQQFFIRVADRMAFITSATGLTEDELVNGSSLLSQSQMASSQNIAISTAAASVYRQSHYSTSLLISCWLLVVFLFEYS
ncbi:trypsin-like cysteine/serine peptidase domain-containing protein [Syncephalis fuscata]|nr:trypsin-like cysteine/serine peptidase domain-containing protein [Syncephalis fuscata]